MARASVRRLRSGIVPGAEIETLSVGYEDLRERILDRMVGLADAERVPPLFVRGEWGTGKSHFISYVRAMCEHLGVASSVANLNARGHALNHPQRSYPTIVENLQFKGRCGLRAILVDALVDSTRREGLASFSEYPADGEIERALRTLLRRSAEVSVPASEDAAWTPILGSDVAWASYAYKRKKALSRIESIGRLFRYLGAGGIVLLFDEVETIDQLWSSRSRKGAYEVLGRLSRLENVWCIFAITARFDRVLEWDLGSLDRDEFAGDAIWFLESWENEELDIVDPPAVTREAAGKLADRVEVLYERAHGFRLRDSALVRRRVEDWLSDPARNPRTLLRAVVDELDRGRPLDSARV